MFQGSPRQARKAEARRQVETKHASHKSVEVSTNVMEGKGRTGVKEVMLSRGRGGGATEKK